MKHVKSKDFPDLSFGQIGALGELAVCADLLSRGYEVFRAVSPSCSVDVIAQKNGKISRVEVKTGYINKNTDRIYPSFILPFSK